MSSLQRGEVPALSRVHSIALSSIPVASPTCAGVRHSDATADSMFHGGPLLPGGVGGAKGLAKARAQSTDS